ncbi:MAG TPA: flagellar hook-length control protein FliK [Desulfobulbaceae bacterium]|nr:flagellar hook-length control protein FliK [Desulfobulbaceae bacterium]
MSQYFQGDPEFAGKKNYKIFFTKDPPMQAMQAIPVAPQPAAPPAEPPATRQTAHGDHFSRHLNDARRHADKPEHTSKKTGSNANTPEKRVSGEHNTSDKKAAQTNKAEKSTPDQTAHTVHSDNGKNEDEHVGGSDKDLLQQVLRNSHLVHQSPETGPSVTIGEPVSAGDNAPLILKVGDSISIQNGGATAPVQDKESIVATLLGKVTGEQDNTSAHPSNTSTQQESIVVEHWQAQFSYTTGANQGKDGKFSQVKQETSGMTLTAQAVQTQVTPVGDQNVAQAHGTHGTGLEAPATPQDANSNYIHSNLPGVKTITDSEASSGNEQQPGQGDQGPTKNSVLTPDLQPPFSQAGSDVPLVFSLDQTTTQAGQVSGLDNQGSLSLHLPSGIEIPHSQIIDQVTGHFAVNRSLESGTITMRLHPAELGELRMEIKVEQDNIKAHITAQNPQVQDILDRNLPRLREALQQQGMNLAHMQVSVATDSGNSQLFQEQFNQRQFENPGRSNRDPVSFSLPEEDRESPLSVDPDQNLSVHI